MEAPASRFAPSPPQSGFLQRLLWRASRTGRAKLALVRACAGQDEAWNDVVRAAEAMEDLPADASTEELYIALVAHGAWHNISLNQLTKASGLVDTLALVAPKRKEHAALTWDLAWAQAAAKDFAQFCTRGQHFTNHKSVTAQDEPAIAQLIDVAYRQGLAAEFIGGLKKRRKQSAAVQGAQALLDLPTHFDDAQQADHAQRRLAGVSCKFSAPLERDRLLALARCAAWQDNLDLQCKLVDEATVCTDANTELHYWQLRSRLASSVASSEPVTDRSNIPMLPTTNHQYTHLEELLRVYQANSPQSGSAYLNKFADELAGLHTLEQPDRTLALTVLKSTVPLDWRIDDDALNASAALCQQLEEALQNDNVNLPWCLYGRGLKAICVDSDYPLTLQLLDDPAVQSLPAANWLKMAAEFMGAQPSDARTTLLDTLDLEQCPEGFRDRVPGLAPTLDLVKSVTGWLANNQVDTIPDTLSSTAPAWAHWLHARLAPLVLPTSTFIAAHQKWPLVQPAVLYEVSNALLERYPMRLPTLMDQLDGDQLASAFDPPSIECGLGPLADALLRGEAFIRDQYQQQRLALRSGAPTQAAAGFAALHAQLADTQELTQVRWQPLIVYWHAVALTRANQTQQAQTLFESLQQTGMSEQAQAQLAMLALQDNNLELATHQLAQAERNLCESVEYCRALLAQRRGDAQLAQEQLTALLASEPSAEFASYIPMSSNYYISAKRLLLTLAEREQPASGPNLDDLAHLTTLGDKRAQLRLLRGQLQNWCALALTPDPDQEELHNQQLVIEQSLATVTQDLESPSTDAIQVEYGQLLNSTAHALFQDGLNTETHAITDEQAQQVQKLRVLLRLHAQDHKGALAELQQMQSPNPHTDAILKSAWMFTDIASGVRSLDDCRQEMQALAATLDTYTDPATQRWVRWLQEMQSHQPSAVDAHTELELVASLLQTPTPMQRSLIDFLDATKQGNEGATLLAYEDLRKHVDDLPVVGIEVWLHCAAIWLKQEQWDELLEAELPECISDLADPRVRWVIGLAYGRAGAGAADAGQLRQALDLLSRAQTTLEPLELTPEALDDVIA